MRQRWKRGTKPNLPLTTARHWMQDTELRRRIKKVREARRFPSGRCGLGYCLERKLQSNTPTSITIELANPVIIAPATSALIPRVMIQPMTGVLTSQAKKPREYPTNQNPNSTIFRPIIGLPEHDAAERW
jgi:hypothetical protein